MRSKKGEPFTNKLISWIIISSSLLKPIGEFTATQLKGQGLIWNITLICEIVTMMFLLFGSELCKIGKFKPALKSATGRVADVIIEALESYGVKGATIYDIPSRGSAQKANSKWLSEGKDCEILRIGAKCWQKGKIKIKVSIEFCPDEPEISQPESPLDDIRQMMNQDN